jgi:hypothetical protein
MIITNKKIDKLAQLAKKIVRDDSKEVQLEMMEVLFGKKMRAHNKNIPWVVGDVDELFA